MATENIFLQLDRNVICKIFLETGKVSELPAVCQIFNTIVKEKAESLYQGLVNEFGKTCLSLAVQDLKLNEKSNAAKIDGLFHAASKNRSIPSEALTGYDLKAIRQHMKPLLVAESVGKLWKVLLKVASPQLKALMGKVPFGQDPFANADLVRQFLKDNLGEIQKVTGLNFMTQQLSYLPPEIGLFTGLKKLDVSYNSITELPEEIGALKELTDFRMSNNALVSLPATIGHLNKMQNFQCSGNRLTHFPEGICAMKGLRTLNLSRNQIDALPEEIGNLQSLNYLFLECNKLSSIPSSLGTAPYLIGLYLFDNRISHLPDSLCKLQNLQYLAVQHNALEALPDGIGNISSLQSLFVDHNALKELPNSICSLKKLGHLSLSSNQLARFPQGMENLTKLKFFHYASNPISSFPEGMEKLPFWSTDPNLYPGIHQGVESIFLNANMTPVEFNRTYWKLGDRKWKEGIDGKDQVHGPEVYDLGLHGKYAEAGYLEGIKKAYRFLGSHPNPKIDAQFYLNLHKTACAHFDGKKTNTLMGKEKIGKFRDSVDIISASFAEPDYLFTDSAINEFNELNGELTLNFGASFRIGDLVLNSKSPKSVTIYYHAFSKQQVEIVFNYFLTEFYYDIGHAQGDAQKIQAIGKLIQRLEWLHSVRDGCGRTDTAFLNFLLTIYGFNPVLLRCPYVSSCKGLREWTDLLMEGMEAWRKEANEPIH